MVGGGARSKKRFERGQMGKGERALRTSQGHRRNAGVASEYPKPVPSPGSMAHGTTFPNSKQIGDGELNRAGGLHVNSGRMINGRPVGIRNGSDVVVAVGGNRCDRVGIVFYESANRVISKEGIHGVAPSDYIDQAYVGQYGRLLYTRPGGWLGDSPIGQDHRNGDDSPSGSGHLSPTNQEVSREAGELSYQVQSASDRRQVIVNEDPFDGSAQARVEIDSDQSLSGRGVSRNRSPISTVGGIRCVTMRR